MSNAVKEYLIWASSISRERISVAYNGIDFDRFDYVLAMDNDNHALLSEQCPDEHRHKLRLFLEFAQQLTETEVPDPYYGGASGFEHVYQLIDAAADGLMADIESRYL